MDENARSLIRKDLNNTYLVEAGAGTGKTTLLVARILEIIESGQALLSQIVAITFTEKSAEELRLRIYSSLENKLKTETESEVHSRLQKAYREVEKSPISTIHSFCSNILREYPIEAGISPSFEVWDKPRSEIFSDFIWQRWIKKQIENENSSLCELLEIGIDFMQLRKMAFSLVLHRDALELPWKPDFKEVDLAEFRRYVSTIITELFELLQYCDNDSDRGFIGVLEIQKQWEKLKELDDSSLSRRLFYGWKIPVEGNQKNWRSADVLRTIKSSLRDLRTYIASIRTLLIHNFTQKAAAWITEFIVQYQEEKQFQQCLDFEDLLVYTRDLLRDNIEVRKNCQERFVFLLIDEFQDTDPLQAEILFFLAAQNIEEKDWRKIDLIPGKLFMVGDPKQSIYRFRRADIEIYEAVKKKLGESNCLAIVRNFRSSRDIIRWCNHCFAKLIRKPEKGNYQSNYQPLFPNRPQPKENSIVILKPPVGTPSLEKARQSRVMEIEAESIASFILDTVGQRPVEENGEIRTCDFQDIALLVRRYTYVELFEQTLSSHNIPYRIVGGKSRYGRVEIRSAIALLRSVANPYDQVSLLAALRSPVFSISDEEIYSHYQKYRSLDYRSNFDHNSEITKIFLLLKSLHDKMGRWPVPKIVEEIFDRTCLLWTFLSIREGQRCVKNLLKIWELAQSVESHKITEFIEFVQRLDHFEKFEEPSRGSGKAVSIFSIHRSKGLEFPVVVLADVGTTKRLPDIIVDRETSSWALRLSGRADLRTENYDGVAEKEQQRQEAEELRLLYVAATRARDCLVIPAMLKDKSSLGTLEELTLSCSDVEIATVHAKDLQKGDLSLASQVYFPLSDTHTTQRTENYIFPQAQQDFVTIDDFFTPKNPTLQKNFEIVRNVICRFFNISRRTGNFEISDIIKRELGGHICDPKKIAVIQDKIDFVVNSEIVERIRFAQSFHCKIPYTWKVSNHSLEGSIDLCFEENERWVIVLIQQHFLPEDDILMQACLYVQLLRQFTGEIAQEVLWISVNENKIQKLFIEEKTVKTALKYFQQMEIMR